MILSFLYRRAAHFLSWPQAPIITFSPRLICLCQAWGKTASAIIHWMGTDVWKNASVQYHLIVLGLKYEISLQICPEETGMLCECRQRRAKWMWIRHSPAGGKSRLWSQEIMTAWFVSVGQPGHFRAGVEPLLYRNFLLPPPPSLNFPRNLIFIPVPPLKLRDKLSGMTLVK